MWNSKITFGSQQDTVSSSTEFNRADKKKKNSFGRFSVTRAYSALRVQREQLQTDQFVYGKVFTCTTANRLVSISQCLTALAILKHNRRG